VELRGVVDLCSAHLLTDLVDHVVVQYAPLWLVLDLAKVRLLSSAGITALLHTRDVLTAQDGRLILRNPSPMTCKVLDITDTARHFDIRTKTIRPDTTLGSGMEIPQANVLRDQAGKRFGRGRAATGPYHRRQFD
jgi:anti-anti-sigma factor